jgi:hypothetical protein
MFKAALAALLLVSVSLPALAHDVYPGCSFPSNTTGSVWYFDPVNGKTPAAWVTYFAANPTDLGIQGDVLHPWNSIQGAVSGQWGASIVVPGYTRPLLSTIPYNHATSAGRVDLADTLGSPPIHPGDTLMLMSGNYGDLSIGNQAALTANSDFVTVKAVPGQTPVLTTLAIGRTNKWLFDGVKVSSVVGTNGNAKPLLWVTDGGAAQPTTDILFEHMDVSSTDDATGAAWTKAQWIANGRLGFSVSGSPGNGTNGEPYLTCVSMTDSRVHNTRVGVALTANSILFSRNDVDHFGDDGIDFAASNLAITHNRIHDNFDVGDANHEDGMQGQVGPKLSTVAYNAFSNILIDANEVIRLTDQKLAFPTYLQGIDAFDSDWTNVTVTNNVVVTSSCYGIQWASVHGSLFAGNTVLNDGLFSTPGCGPAVSVGLATHEGLETTNTRVTNNLADHFFIGDQASPGLTYDHNVALNSYQPFVHWNGTAWAYSVPVGTDANGNVSFATSVPYASVFQQWTPAVLNFDLRIKTGTVADGVAVPFSVGAHAYGY